MELNVLQWLASPALAWLGYLFGMFAGMAVFVLPGEPLFEHNGNASDRSIAVDAGVFLIFTVYLTTFFWPELLVNFMPVSNLGHIAFS